MKRNEKTKNITDGLEILENRLRKDPAMKRRVDQEFMKLQIGQQIYNLRQEAKLTQAELADLVGTKHSVISRMESAEYDGHSLKMLQRIAASLGKTLRVEIEDLPKRSTIKNKKAS
jgi:DNA-binding XRE family transcriptional regulator